MAAKIRIKVGSVEVDYEGSDQFLEKKLPALIDHLAALAKDVPADATDKTEKKEEKGDSKVGALASFINDKAKGKSQVIRFLATAEWLHRKNGRKNIKTAEVSKALRDNHQKKISNPADTLNQNVTKGHCEKVGSEFFVTEEGKKELG